MNKTNQQRAGHLSPQPAAGFSVKDMQAVFRKGQRYRIKTEEEAAKKAEEEKAAREAEEAKGYETGITYENLARTPDDYGNKKVKFYGKVVQVMEAEWLKEAVMV